MIEYIFLVIIKIFDNVISTAKNICQFKELKMLSSVLTVASQLLFYLVISQVIADNTFLSIAVVSISAGLGNYLAFLLNSKFRKDTKWTMVLTSSDVEDIKKLCHYLTEHKIKYIANDGYTRRGEHTINVIAFSKSKDESRLIERFLKNTESKYLKEII